MSKAIKIISIIGCFLDILAMISVWFVDDLNTLKIACFLWIFLSFGNNIRDFKRGGCNE
ncbi:MAG: hypothetical protein ACRC1T_05030 [Clostridium chrysemydis]|uniref:hypothetical protein n=1 Tax=Clostridium chrysemydis TaxID=2665504 RepID=UPI003F2A89CA